MWKNILKRSQSKFSSNNLPMLKDMIGRMLDDIPNKFTDYLPSDAPIGFSKWWGKEGNVQSRRGIKWFKSYFPKYARNRNKVETLNVDRQLSKYRKL